MSTSTAPDPSVEIWIDDLLYRQQDARIIIDFLSNRVTELTAEGKTASYVLNLDARWGDGKTFFMRRLQRQLEVENYLAAYVSAWESDFSDDPMVPVMAAIRSSVAEYLQEPAAKSLMDKVTKNGASIAVGVAKGVLKTAVKRYVGQNLDELTGDGDKESFSEETTDQAINDIGKGIEKITDRYAESLLDEFEKRADSVSTFRDSLTQLVQHAEAKHGRQPVLFILVDELDRCRPTYAITLLERIKHLFSANNVVFVIATDSSQLSHSMRGAYGGEFDGQTYLKRFFDRTYKFAKPDKQSLVAKYLPEIETPKIKWPVDETYKKAIILSEFIDYFSLSLRDFEQIMDIVKTAHTIWTYDLPMEGFSLLSTAIVFHQNTLSDFNDIVAFVKETHRQKTRNSDWEMPLEVFDIDYQTGRAKDARRLNVWSILYSLQIQVDDVFNHRHKLSQSQRFEQQYAYEIICLERNGKRPNQPTPSIQKKIGDIVRSAGRLNTAS